MTIDPDGLDPDFGPPLERVRSFDAQKREDDRARAQVPAVDRAFEGPAERADALRALVARAVAVDARRLVWCDPDFTGWPLGEPGVVDALARWARGGQRELLMIATRWEGVARLHPRFVAWRRDFAHVVQCLEPDESFQAVLPSLWLDSSGQVLRVFDAERVRGRAGTERSDCQQAAEDFDAIAQRATPGFAAVTLGL